MWAYALSSFPDWYVDGEKPAYAKFLSGESIPDKDYFNSILEKCEKYPEILEIAKNNETISGFYSLCALCNNYEKNPEFVKKSLNLKKRL